MRRVEFDPEKLRGKLRDWWTSWSAESVSATRNVLADWSRDRTVKLKPRIWSLLKAWLLEHVFHRKCAYCEGRYTAGSFDDAEHWRPKSLVAVKRGDHVEVVRCPDGLDHPGYFWLAYDWRNLLPACERCNRGSGKMNQFPVAIEHICVVGTDFLKLDQLEQPYLLHPYHDQPRDHLEFLDQGVVRARNKSSRGEHTINVFRLDRGELEEERAERQEEAEKAFVDALLEAWKRGVPIEESMANYTGPGARYSEAVKDHLSHKHDELLRQFLNYSRKLET